MTRVKPGKSRMDVEGLEDSDDWRDSEGAVTATSVDNELLHAACVCANINM
jgi:hypothetical protein